jgi:hypothetical protein
MANRTRALRAAVTQAERFLDTLHERRVGAPTTASAIRRRLGGPLSEEGEEPAAVIDALAEDADPGLVASAGPRYFGFVTTTPARSSPPSSAMAPAGSAAPPGTAAR